MQQQQQLLSRLESLDLVAPHRFLDEAGRSLKLPVLEARSISVFGDQAAC
jgi:hypothetical protein